MVECVYPGFPPKGEMNKSVHGVADTIVATIAVLF